LKNPARKIRNSKGGGDPEKKDNQESQENKLEKLQQFLDINRKVQLQYQASKKEKSQMVDFNVFVEQLRQMGFFINNI